MTIKFNSFLKFGLLLCILSTPLLSVGDVYGLITGTLKSQSVINTPLYFKFFKDICLFIVIMFSILYVLNRPRVPIFSVLVIILFALVTLPSIIYSSGNNFWFMISGIRWMFPFIIFLFLLLIPFSPNIEMDYSKYVFILLILHFILQLFQFFFGGHWFGSYFGIFSLRNPGMFLMPSTAAMFSIISYVYLIHWSKNHLFLLSTLVLFSVVLTASGTGFIVIIFLLGYIFLLKVLRLSFNACLILSAIGLSIMVPFLYSFAGLIGRGDDYVAKSGGTRLTIFIEQFESAGFISSHFGYATNSAVLLGRSIGLDGAFIVDSMYTSILVNLGLLGFFAYILVILLFFMKSIVIKNYQYFMLLFTVVVFSFSVNWSESFPYNIMAIVIMLSMIKKKNKNV